MHNPTFYYPRIMPKLYYTLVLTRANKNLGISSAILLTLNIVYYTVQVFGETRITDIVKRTKITPYV